MKFALRRSLILWSGLLAMGFCIWAWRDSMKWESWLEGRGLYAANSGAAIVVAWESKKASEEFNSERMEIWMDSRLPGLFREPAWVRGENRRFEAFSELEEFSAKFQGELDSEILRLAFPTHPSQDFMLLVPHWMILTVMGCVWLGLLAWKGRRTKKAGKMVLS